MRKLALRTRRKFLPRLGNLHSLVRNGAILPFSRGNRLYSLHRLKCFDIAFSVASSTTCTVSRCHCSNIRMRMSLAKFLCNPCLAGWSSCSANCFKPSMHSFRVYVDAICRYLYWILGPWTFQKILNLSIEYINLYMGSSRISHHFVSLKVFLCLVSTMFHGIAHWSLLKLNVVCSLNVNQTKFKGVFYLVASFLILFFEN